jgi:DNA polymerase III epsilon subunit-like protein
MITNDTILRKIIMEARQVVVYTHSLTAQDQSEQLVEISCIELKNQALTQRVFHQVLHDKNKFVAVADEFIQIITNAQLVFTEINHHTSLLNSALLASNKKPLKDICESTVSINTFARSLLPLLPTHQLDSLITYFQIKNTGYNDKIALDKCVSIAKIFAHLTFLKQAESLNCYAPKNRNPILDRCYSDASFVNEAKETESLKVAVLIEKDKMPLYKTKRLANSLAIIPGYRPVNKILAHSEDLSPVEVSTPGDSKLIRSATFGVFSIYTNHPRAKLEQQAKPVVMSDDSDFLKSKVYADIKKMTDLTKKIEMNVTSKQLDKACDDRFQDKEHTVKVKLPARGLLMSNAPTKVPASASKYAEATQLFAENIRWEWLPLIGFMILGKDSLSDKNTVAGTADAATLLMLNDCVHQISEYYPQGFSLKVTANLIPNTHIAQSIQFEIQTKDFTFPIMINAQTQNRPHYVYGKIIHALVAEMLELVKNPLKPSDRLLKRTNVDKLFFQKKPVEKVADLNDAVSKNLRSQRE